jgi:cysteine desulfuration protein SufE
MSDLSKLETIKEVQDKLISEFQSLEGDREAMLSYIIEIGEKMPAMDAVKKIEPNTLSGCVSTVWLTYKVEDKRLFFEGDSNASITKGLVAILLRILSGQLITDIIHANLFIVSKIGMLGLIGPQRSSGFGGMVSQIKAIAITENAKFISVQDEIKRKRGRPPKRRTY